MRGLMPLTCLDDRYQAVSADIQLSLACSLTASVARLNQNSLQDKCLAWLLSVYLLILHFEFPVFSCQSANFVNSVFKADL